MEYKDWKSKRSKNPYVHKSWINTKEGLLIEIISDIGFGKQRNVVVYNYRNQTYSGYEVIHTEYCSSEKEALSYAKQYMRTH